MTEEIFDIIFLRHGESTGNVETRWQGQTDYPLTDRGRDQARALADRWLAENKVFDVILASPLARAKETAEILGDALDVKVDTDRIWMERDVGRLAGLTQREVKEKVPATNARTPFESIGLDGEGDWELYLRAGKALHRLLQRTPGKYLIVSHGGLLNQVMYTIIGIAPQGNSSGVRFRFGNTGFAHVIYYPVSHHWRVLTINDRAHWDGAE